MSESETNRLNFSLGHHWRRRPPAPPVPVIGGETALKAGVYRHIKTVFWTLDYTFTDCGRYRIGNSGMPWRVREAHTSHLYAPGTIVWEDTRGVHRRPFHFAYVSFRGEDTFLRRLIDNRRGYARFLDPEGRIGAILSAIAGFAGRLRDDGFWQGQGRLCEALHLLRRAEAVEEETYRFAEDEPISACSELARAVDDYLRHNPQERPSVPTLARALHMGVSTLLHRYRRETGSPLMQHVMRQRIALARELLLQGHSGKSVALQLGFCDDSHFSKTFRRIEGCSPSDFVRAPREGWLVAPDSRT
jgi:AraC-like DNA-binding protein